MLRLLHKHWKIGKIVVNTLLYTIITFNNIVNEYSS